MMSSALKMSSRWAALVTSLILGTVCTNGCVLVLIGLYVRFWRYVSVSFRGMLHILTV